MSFPAPLAAIQDSKYFREEQIDETVKGELEGGYYHTRPRTTRAPRKRFVTGFTSISDANKVILETFFADKGTHTSFVYTHPVSLQTFTCRFGKQLSYKYTGAGLLVRWDVSDIMIEEV